MYKPRKKPKPALTPEELAWIAEYDGNASATARRLGKKGTNAREYGYCMMKRPYIKEAIRKKQEKALETAGRELGKKLVKADITGRLLKAIDRLDQMADKIKSPKSIANLAKATDSIVDACHEINEMQQYIIKATRDMTEEFKDRTEEELSFFAENGYFQNHVDSGEPGTPASESAGAAAGKPN